MFLTKHFPVVAVCLVASKPCLTRVITSLSHYPHRGGNCSIIRLVRTFFRGVPCPKSQLSWQRSNDHTEGGGAFLHHCSRAWQSSQRPERHATCPVYTGHLGQQQEGQYEELHECNGDDQTKALLARMRQLVDLYGPNNARLETWKEQEEREAREGMDEEEPGGPAHYQKHDANVPFHQIHQPWPNCSEEDSESIERLEELLEHRSLSPEIAYDIYTSLPWPRAAYLSYTAIRCLLNCLGVVRRCSEEAMLRYLSIIDDMKAANMPVALADWNMAIQFAGKAFKRVVTANEVESALYLWREMERKSGTSGNHVTFNILFDISVKAGNYALAEMIRNEMKDRGLRLDRYFRTSVIMWRGLAHDGNGIRSAYRELVDAGEIVDTTVMNCVISALIKANEPAAAEQVFLRMKAMHATRLDGKVSPQDWRQRRELGYLLSRASAHAQGNSGARRAIQEHSPVGPDYTTFRLLIKHHTTASGNINRIKELLSEMDRVYKLPLHGDMFYTLLHGFHLHGGVRYSSWTRAQLESTWRALIMLLDQRNDEYFFLDRPLVMATILAFSKCAGQDKTMLVWAEIKKRWNPCETDLQYVINRLASLFPSQSSFS